MSFRLGAVAAFVMGALAVVACSGTVSSPSPSSAPPSSPSVPALPTSPPAASPSRVPSTPEPSRTPTPSRTPEPSRTAAPTPSPTVAGVVVTFRVVETETYRVLLTDAADITNAQDLLAGKEAPGIPNGRLVLGASGVNTGHDWSIDPEDIEFADMTTEVCDGTPSQIDDGTFTNDRFCPWTAKVVAIEPAGS